MKTQIKGRNVTVTPALQDYANEKIEHVHKLLLQRKIDEVTRVELELQVEKNPSIPEPCIAEATVFTRGPVIRARESSTDMYAAIDLVTDKLRAPRQEVPRQGAPQVAPQVRDREGRAGRGRRGGGGRGGRRGSPPRVAAEAAAVAAASPNGSSAHSEEAEEAVLAAVGEEDHGAVVKVKRFPLKPMSVEEATLQLELVGHDFFVFQNADTDTTNVVYRRRDRHYGLIIPETV